MCLIFYGSTDVGSVGHTSRIIGPFLRWLKPDISDAAIHDVQVVVRKSGHVSEYAVLALLFWFARRRTVPAASWNWREIRLIVFWCALYASSDELHQLFVPSRGASPFDVLIDACGATAGLLLFWLIGRKFKLRSAAHSTTD